MNLFFSYYYPSIWELETSLPKTDLEKTRTATPDETSHGLGRYTAKTMQKANDPLVLPMTFGLKNSRHLARKIDKKSYTSIVARVWFQHRRKAVLSCPGFLLVVELAQVAHYPEG